MGTHGLDRDAATPFVCVFCGTACVGIASMPQYGLGTCDACAEKSMRRYMDGAPLGSTTTLVFTCVACRQRSAIRDNHPAAEVLRRARICESCDRDAQEQVRQARLVEKDFATNVKPPPIQVRTHPTAPDWIERYDGDPLRVVKGIALGALIVLALVGFVVLVEAASR